MTLTNGLEMATAKQHLMALDAYLKTRQGHESALIHKSKNVVSYQIAAIEARDNEIARLNALINEMAEDCIDAEQCESCKQWYSSVVMEYLGSGEYVCKDCMPVN